jgi:glutaredoxin
MSFKENNDITIYSKEGCPNCDKAWELCKAENPTIKKLGRDFDKEDFANRFSRHYKEYPVIHCNGVLYSFDLFNRLYPKKSKESCSSQPVP